MRGSRKRGCTDRIGVSKSNTYKETVTIARWLAAFFTVV